MYAWYLISHIKKYVNEKKTIHSNHSISDVLKSKENILLQVMKLKLQVIIEIIKTSTPTS